METVRALANPSSELSDQQTSAIETLLTTLLEEQTGFRSSAGQSPARELRNGTPHPGDFSSRTSTSTRGRSFYCSAQEATRPRAFLGKDAHQPPSRPHRRAVSRSPAAALCTLAVLLLKLLAPLRASLAEKLVYTAASLEWAELGRPDHQRAGLALRLDLPTQPKPLSGARRARSYPAPGRPRKDPVAGVRAW